MILVCFLGVGVLTCWPSRKANAAADTLGPPPRQEETDANAKRRTCPERGLVVFVKDERVLKWERERARPRKKEQRRA